MQHGRTVRLAPALPTWDATIQRAVPPAAGFDQRNTLKAFTTNSLRRSLFGHSLCRGVVPTISSSPALMDPIDSSGPQVLCIGDLPGNVLECIATAVQDAGGNVAIETTLFGEPERLAGPIDFSTVDIVVCRGRGLRLGPATLGDAKKNLLIITLSKDCGHICPPADRSDIRVVPVGANAEAVADLAFTLAHLLLRSIHRVLLTNPAYRPQLHEGASSFRGKNLLVLGGGDQAFAIVSRYAGWGLNRVTICARTQRAWLTSWLSVDNRIAYEPCSGRPVPPRVVEQADIISIHLKATENTRRIVDADFLGHVRRGAYLINVSRESHIEPKAVLTALRSGHLGGYAADVVTPRAEETANYRESLLWTAAVHEPSLNILLTPHIGGSTAEAYLGATEAALEVISRELHADGN